MSRIVDQIKRRRYVLGSGSNKGPGAGDRKDPGKTERKISELSAARSTHYRMKGRSKAEAKAA